MRADGRCQRSSGPSVAALRFLLVPLLEAVIESDLGYALLPVNILLIESLATLHLL